MDRVADGEESEDAGGFASGGHIESDHLANRVIIHGEDLIYTHPDDHLSEDAHARGRHDRGITRERKIGYFPEHINFQKYRERIPTTSILFEILDRRILENPPVWGIFGVFEESVGIELSHKNYCLLPSPLKGEGLGVR